MITKNSILITALYFLLVGFHVVASWHHDAPHVKPDEFSYLAQAQYFAGKYTFPDENSDLAKENNSTGSVTNPFEIPYYHFGYSLLVSPIYWATDSPTSAYKGIMVFNSFMLSTLFLIVFYWIRMVRDINLYAAAGIAFVVSLYPPYVLHAYIGWAENALIPGFALSCLLFTRHLKVSNITTLVQFAVISGFQYTLHPRGAAVALAAILCLIFLSLAQKDKWQFSATGVIIILGIMIATKIIANDMAILMNAVQHDGSIIDNLRSIISNKLVTVFLGNLLYLILASLGIFLFGFTESLKQLINKSTINFKTIFSNIYTGSLIYIFIASILTFCMSIIFLARKKEWHDSNQLLDLFLHGRYNETYLSMYIALGLLWIYFSKEHEIRLYRKQFNIGFLFITFISFTCAYLLADYIYMRAIHSFSLYPWFAISFIVDEWIGNALVIFAPLLWTWLLLQLLFQSKLKVFFTIGIYFILLDVFLIEYVNPNFKLLGG
jgi:hypothetical protein